MEPFFITHPTDKGMALCLCKLCLNIRMLQRVLMDQEKKDGGEVTMSTSEFLLLVSHVKKLKMDTINGTVYPKSARTAKI